MDNVEVLINDLENIVYNAKKSMFGGGNDIIVNRSQLLSLIADIKAGLPEELTRAKVISRDANRIMDDANARANAILNQAETQRQLLIDESDVLKEATEYANQIKAEADSLKDSAEYDTKVKIDQLLADTEANLTDALSLVRTNREALRNK